MKLVQKKRQGELKNPNIHGQVKNAKISGGGIQIGLGAFFKRSSNSTHSALTKRKTPPTSPENCESDIEIIEIDFGSNDKAKKVNAGT